MSDDEKLTNQYLRGRLEGSEVQNRTLHVVIERLLRERQDTAWDKDVRAALAAFVAATAPTIRERIEAGRDVGLVPVKVAMQWADEIEKGRQERAKAKE